MKPFRLFEADETLEAEDQACGLLDVADGHDHAGHEGLAADGVVPDRERLAGAAEHHLLMGDEPWQADTVYGDAV